MNARHNKHRVYRKASTEKRHKKHFTARSLSCDLWNKLTWLEDITDMRGGGYTDGVYMCESSDMDGRTSLLKPEIYTFDFTLNPDMPSMLREAMAACMRSLKTNGDGACGVHALLGVPWPMSAGLGRYELFADNARDIAVQHLGPSLAALEQRLHIEDRVRAIKDFFWDGFVVAHLKGPPHQLPKVRVSGVVLHE